jgi:hypothetical protein
MRHRTLSLKRESLSELTGAELVAVAGGAQDLSHLYCNLTDNCGHGASFDQCPTLPVNQCRILTGAYPTSPCAL